MNKPITSISEIIGNFIRSFVGGSGHDDEEKRRRIFFAVMMLVSILIMFSYGFHHLNKGNSTRGLSLLTVGLIQTISFISLRHLQNPLIIYRINVALIGCCLLFIMIIGIEGGAGILWIFLFPPITFILLGKKEGLLLSTIAFILSLFFLIDPHSTIGTYPDATGIKTRFPVIYGLLVLMGYIVRSVLQRYEVGMEKEQLKLQSEVKVRIEAEEELKKYHDHLEELVQQRTSEITIANEKLMNEVEEHKKAKEALREAYDIISRSPVVAFLRKNEEGWPVEFVSDNVDNLFGYTAEQFVSGKVDYASTIHPEDLERFAGEVLRFSKEEGRERFTHESYRIVTKDRTVKWLDDRIYIRRDEKGKITHYQGIVEDITERKRMEEALQFTRFSIDNAVDTMVTVDHDARFIDVNDAFCRFAGYSREELLSKTVHDIDPDYSAEIWPEFWEKLKQAGSLTFESCHRTKEGKVFPVEITANFFEYNGKEYHCGFARDITDRKRAEEKLRESEERYRSLFDGVPISLYRTTPTGQIIDANPALVEMLGYPDLESLLAMAVAETYANPEDRIQWQTIIECDGIVKNYEKQLRRHDGSIIWVEENTRVVCQSDGRVLYYEGSFQDITERKRAEEEIKSLARFPSENPNPIFRLNQDGLILYVNKASQVLLQDWGCGVGSYAQTFWRDLVAEAMSSQSARTIDIKFGEQTYLFNMVPILDAGYVNFYVSDITERKQMEEERENLLADLEGKNRELEAFVYTISHDLKAPLVSLNGFSGALQKDYGSQLGKEGRHYLERIQANVAHMGVLITNLLELSRIGRVVGSIEEIDVGVLLREVRVALEVRLKEAGAEFVVQELLPTVRGDRGRIHQVFANLIENAAKFRSVERALRIEVGCRQESGFYRFHVTDNGIGIAPRYQEHIFTPFRKLYPEIEGVGIGLALVKKIVEHHGGHVWVESEVGKGATFYFTMPITNEQ